MASGTFKLSELLKLDSFGPLVLLKLEYFFTVATGIKPGVMGTFDDFCDCKMSESISL